jgi:hypothetical protein
VQTNAPILRHDPHVVWTIIAGCGSLIVVELLLLDKGEVTLLLLLVK